MTGAAKKYSLLTLSVVVLASEILFWVVVMTGYYSLSADKGFRLENENAVWFFAFIPILICAYFYFTIRGNISLKRLADRHLSGKLTLGASNWRMALKYALLRIGLGCVVIALCNPQYGKKEVEGRSQGVEIMIALDVSNSMLARDLSETRTRLNIAKLAIERLTTELHGDKIGIVVFAGSAYTQLPITSDYNAAKLFLSGVSPGMLSSQGTSIGAAIEECIRSFDMESETSKAIIIISDGENHEEGAIQVASNAASVGLQIHTIGMGTAKGTPIELYRGDKKIGVKKDKDGNTVITKLNEEFLKEVSQIGNGTYTRASKTNVGLGRLLEGLRQMDQTTLAKDTFLEYEDHFQGYLAIGVVLLFLNMLIPMNSKRNVQLNLFAE